MTEIKIPKKHEPAVGALLALGKLPKDNPNGAQSFANDDFGSPYIEMDAATRIIAVAYDYAAPHAAPLLRYLQLQYPEFVSSWLATMSREIHTELPNLAKAASINPLGEVGVLADMSRFFSPIAASDDSFVVWMPKEIVETAQIILQEVTKICLTRGESWIRDKHLERYQNQGFFLDTQSLLASQGDRVLLSRDWLVQARELIRSQMRLYSDDTRYTDIKDSFLPRLQAAYESTTPPMPFSHSAILAMLKHEHIGDQVVNITVTERHGIMLCRYGIETLGDLVLSELGGHRTILDFQTDDAAEAVILKSLRSLGTPVNAADISASPFGEFGFQIIREIFTDRGIVPNAIHEDVIASYQKWRSSEGQDLYSKKLERPGLVSNRDTEEW